MTLAFTFEELVNIYNEAKKEAIGKLPNPYTYDFPEVIVPISVHHHKDIKTLMETSNYPNCTIDNDMLYFRFRKVRIPYSNTYEWH